MGKWASGYYDQVLHSKIKSLVSGAIKRSKLEKAEPEINFERFVEELDIGDSFTTSLVDVLVKEVADRQTRSNVVDRRLICERTSKTLRTISNPHKVYFSTVTRRLAARTPSAYLTGEDMDLYEDDDDFAIIDTDSTLRRTSMFDYPQSGTSSVVAPVLPFVARTSSPTPIGSTDDSLPDFPSYTRSWTRERSYVNPSSSLTRSASVRRPARSRTVDFNDFTSRRRSTIRSNTDSSNIESSTTPEFMTRPRDSSWVPSSGARRFFPGLTRRRRVEVPYIGDDVLAHFDPLSRQSSDPTAAETSDERNADSSASLLPRLRRGGLRAPESLFSRQASPTETATVIASDGSDHSRRAPSPPDITEYLFDSPRFSSIPIQESGATYSIEGATGYPTPGSSIDNENFA